jgi:Short C-terminal domain/Domain of unknown function (DUF4429)
MNKYNGYGATLIVDNNKIIIKRSGFLSLLTHGSKGDKEIYIKNITAIQLKKPGFTNGYIQFSLPGEKGSKGGILDATKDENTILISGNKQYTEFLAAKNLIEKLIHEHNSPTTIDKPNNSVSDELIKLASLRDSGILTQNEFEIQKQKILNK